MELLLSEECHLLGRFLFFYREVKKSSMRDIHLLLRPKVSNLDQLEYQIRKVQKNYFYDPVLNHDVTIHLAF